MLLLPLPVFAFLDGLGGPELFLIFVLSLMLFGGKKLPELARSVGQAVREFKRAASGVEIEFRRAMDSETPSPKPAARPKIITPQIAPPAAPPPAAPAPPSPLSNATPDEEKLG